MLFRRVATIWTATGSSPRWSIPRPAAARCERGCACALRCAAPTTASTSWPSPPTTVTAAAPPTSPTALGWAQGMRMRIWGRPAAISGACHPTCSCPGSRQPPASSTSPWRRWTCGSRADSAVPRPLALQTRCSAPASAPARCSAASRTTRQTCRSLLQPHAPSHTNRLACSRTAATGLRHPPAAASQQRQHDAMYRDSPNTLQPTRSVRRPNHGSWLLSLSRNKILY